MPKMTPNRISKKNVLRYNGDMCVVLECITRTPPNLRAFVQMEMRSLTSGKSFPVRCSTGEEFEVLENRSRELEFSYENQGTYVFMDPDTFDQIEIQKNIIGDAVNFLVANQRYEVLFVEESPLLINLPTSVIMTVTEATDAVRGNTSSNATKEVTLETGLRIQVPMFIKNGEKLKVGTENKEYLGRA
ncbi:MAG: elongation factor P [Fibrobacterota bacterium]